MSSAPLHPTRRELIAAALGLPLLAARRPARAAQDAHGSAPADDAAPAGTSSAARPPNVLFVFSDSHRAVSTGCYGNDDVATPALDAFAAQGVRVPTCVSNTPVCRPFRASFFTGSHAHRSGMLSNASSHNFAVDDTGQWQPPAELPTLGTHFQRAGYRCGYIGKWHLGRIAVEPGPLRFGFDDLWYVARKPAHDYREWEYVTGTSGDFVSGRGNFRTDHEVDVALEFLRASKAESPERPVLLTMSWGPPHGPLIAPPGFERDSARLPPNVTSAKAKAIARKDLPNYYGLVEAMDASWAKLMAGLAALDMERDTIVVYTSDHGNQLGAQDRTGKEYAYSDSSRVPLMLRWPGQLPAGSTLDSLVGTPDLFPTLCGLAGLPQPEGADGMNLAAALRGEAGATVREEALLIGADTELLPFPGWRALRTERHLYARDEKGPRFLYEVQSDPYEMNNLVDRRAKAVAALDERLREAMRALGDRWRPA
ncbi:MAG: sulfatase [Planctomycetota bacterium]|nr:MAG: sulfatase [Planctomycetota bacterium]